MIEEQREIRNPARKVARDWYGPRRGSGVPLAPTFLPRSGYSAEYEIERRHRDAAGWAIAGGTPDIPAHSHRGGVSRSPFQPASVR